MNKKTITLKLAIDPHAHARDMNQTETMTVIQTFKEAKRSGIGTVCLMPNTSPSIDCSSVMNRYLSLINDATAKTYVNGYLWIALSDLNHSSIIHMLKHPQVIGVKIYPLRNDGISVTTGNVGIKKWSSLEKLLDMMVKYGIYKPIAGHWEDPELGHSVESEVSALKQLVDLAEKYSNLKFTACHITSAQGLKIISDAQKKDLKIMIEITPHHLWFCNEEVDVNSGMYKCFPPIKSCSDKKALRDFIRDNTKNPLVSIGSDSAPHLTKVKESDNPPAGLATIQHIIPVILSLQKELGLNEDDIERLISKNIARYLGIKQTKEFSKWVLDPMENTITYNNGKVDNPFQGEKLIGKMTTN
jgi:dihydroorotase